MSNKNTALAFLAVMLLISMIGCEKKVSITGVEERTPTGVTVSAETERDDKIDGTYPGGLNRDETEVIVESEATEETEPTTPTEPVSVTEPVSATEPPSAQESSEETEATAATENDQTDNNGGGSLDLGEF